MLAHTRVQGDKCALRHVVLFPAGDSGCVYVADVDRSLVCHCAAEEVVECGGVHGDVGDGDECRGHWRRVEGR